MLFTKMYCYLQMSYNPLLKPFWEKYWSVFREHLHVKLMNWNANGRLSQSIKDPQSMYGLKSPGINMCLKRDCCEHCDQILEK